MADPPTTDLAPASDGRIVNLRTGELLEQLDAQPPEILADALDTIREHQAQLKEATDLLEDELRRRLKMRGAKFAVFGEWEVEASTTRKSIWDAAELEPALEQLVASGVVRAGDVADVITREPTVSLSKAKALSARLTGDAKALVEATHTWQEKPGKLTVVRSVALPEALSAPDPPPVAASPDSPPDRPTRARGAPQAPLQPTPPNVLTPEELFA